MAQAALATAARRPVQDEDPRLAAWVGEALEAALRARAPGLHASTPMVRELAAKVGRELRLDAQSSALLDLSVRVRDVGMAVVIQRVVEAEAARFRRARASRPSGCALQAPEERLVP